MNMKSNSIEAIKLKRKQLYATYRHNQEKSWWISYLFHFTDIDNALTILDEGTLYSRENVLKNNLMFNDNASLEVIKHTDENIKSYVRFYFRPKTPTQYNNEGFKFYQDRGHLNAHCPRPIFFLFSLIKTFDNNECYFSDVSVASHSHHLYSNYEDINKLDFSKIYHNGYYNKDERDDIVAHRHAEVLIKDKMDLENSLVQICCRSQAEYETFIRLLVDKNPLLLEKYSKYITYKRVDLFYKNGYFIEEANLYYNHLSLLFNVPDPKKDNESCGFVLKIQIIHGAFIKEKIIPVTNKLLRAGLRFHYTNKTQLMIQNKYDVKVFFDDTLMYYGGYEGEDIFL